MSGDYRDTIRTMSGFPRTLYIVQTGHTGNDLEIRVKKENSILILWVAGSSVAAGLALSSVFNSRVYD